MRHLFLAKSSGRLILAACLVFCLISCAPQQPSVRDGRAPAPGFTLVALPAPHDQTMASLLYDGHEIARDGPFRDVAPEPAVEDPFDPGCRVTKVELFTGGANCCFGYYFLAECPAGAYAGYLEPYGGSAGEFAPVPGVGVGAYPITDPAFMYYGPEDDSGTLLFSLIRPDSPRPERFLLRDANGWRPDYRGEFPAAYAAMAADVRENADIPPVARAITAAYYDLMAEKDAKSVARTLKRELPQEYAPHASVIFTDIESAVESFNPVKNLGLPAGS